MNCAQQPTKLGDGSQESVASPRRPWYRLHVPAWSITGAALAIVTLLVVPGRVNNHGIFTGSPLFREHGWPFVFVDRCLDPPSTSPAASGTENPVLKELRGNGLRSAWSPDLDDPLRVIGPIEPSWLDKASWEFGGEYVIHGTALVLDLMTALGIVASIAAICEWWRRRFWRYSIRGLLGGLVLLSAAFAWYRSFTSDYERESQVVAALTDKGCEMHLRCDAPVWLRILVGASHLRSFHRVVFISTRYDDGTDGERTKPRQITDIELELIGQLHQLERLLLDGANISDSGVQHLHDLRRLRYVSFENTRLTDAGLAHIHVLPCLKELDVSGTQVTDAGLRHLEGALQLKWLELSGTKATDAGVTRLRKALPQCEILFHDQHLEPMPWSSTWPGRCGVEDPGQSRSGSGSTCGPAQSPSSPA